MDALWVTSCSNLVQLAAVTCFIFALVEPESTTTTFKETSESLKDNKAHVSDTFHQQENQSVQQQNQRGTSGANRLSLMLVPDEQILMERLLDRYHKYSRPVINSSLSVVVKFGLTLVQISDMDEVNQVLTINVWLEQEWVDERLTWDPKDYNNLHILRIPCEKLWLPDIVLYNSADDYTTGYMNSKAMVRSDGNVFWPPPAKFRSSCKIDITYFPFDDQTCELKFGSWTYDGFQVDITNRSSTVDLNNYVFSGEWELIKVAIRRTEMTYACCIEPYPDVRFTIVMRRKTLYYLFNIICPCLWLTILSLLGFWLPPDSGEKITLGITVLLAFSVFMLLIAESMPATSEFVPLIGIYLTVTMGMTSLSIILTVFVLQLHHVGPHKRRVPRWLRSLVFDILARIVCMYNSSQSHTQDFQRILEKNTPGIVELTNVTTDSGDVSGEAAGIITGGERKGFIIDNSEKRKSIRGYNSDVLLQRSSCNSERVAPACNQLSPATIGFQDRQCTDFSFLKSSYYDISTNFHPNMGNSLRASLGRDQQFRHSFREGYPFMPRRSSDNCRPLLQTDSEFYKYQELVQEWQFVAHVTDRLLFWLFLFVSVVSSLAILVIKPLFKPAVV